VTTANITPAELMVSADDQTRAYGADNPTLTAGYSGFVGGETLASGGVTGDPDLNTTATNTSPAGDYSITAALGSLSAVNYTFSFIEGNLTITPAGSVTLTSLLRLGNGHARIAGTGDAGTIYTIEASADLVDWQDIGNATAEADGAFEFDDPNAAHLSRCFYRIKLP
jgi:MBG domain (YGX type)